MATAPDREIRILLVDDVKLFRQTLRIMLERHGVLRVVGEAGDGEDAVVKAHELMPDIVLMDVRMPGGDGLAALKQINRELPAVDVVMLTVSEDDEDLFAAVKAGAKGYLLKSIEAQELVQAVEYIAQGGVVLSPFIAGKLLAEFKAIAVDEQASGIEAMVADLTAREKEILALLGQGLGNREIAAKLCITDNTIKSHLRNIMEKLHVHSRAQAVAYAVRSSFASRGKRSRQSL